MTKEERDALRRRADEVPRLHRDWVRGSLLRALDALDEMEAELAREREMFRYRKPCADCDGRILILDLTEENDGD